jgi:hypothetical protein
VGAFLYAVGSRISGNHTDGVGGGVLAQPTTIVHAELTHVTGNRSEGDGGGLHVRGTIDPYGPTFLDLRRTTVAGNRTVAGTGGGLVALGRVEGGFNQSVLWRNCGPVGSAQALADGENVSLGALCSSVDSSGVEVQNGASFNFSVVSFADPRFCDPLSCFSAPSAHGDFRYEPGSECLPENGPCDLLIGVSGAACGSTVSTGSCCTDDSFCFVASMDVCDTIQGDYGGDATTCDPEPCSSAGVEPPVSRPNPLQLAVTSPASRAAALVLQTPLTGPLTVDVFDAEGRRIRRLVDGDVRATGETRLEWDLTTEGGRPVAAGLYFVRAAVSGSEAVERIVVVR